MSNRPEGLFVRRDERWHGFARLPPAGEVPGIREAGALPGLHGLDAAVAAIEEDALVIVSAIGGGAFVDEGEAVAVRAQAGIVLDEIVLTQAKEPGDPVDFGFLEADETGPAAAVRAALALVVDFGRHACGANEPEMPHGSSANCESQGRS